MVVFKKWLSSTYPEVASFFSELSEFDDLLKSKKLSDGFTFLLPNAEYVENLRQVAEEDEDAALERVCALFLPIHLRNVGDFRYNSEDIPNMRNYKLPIYKIEGSTVFLGKSGKTKLNALQLNVECNFSVFKVQGGAVPMGRAKSSYLKKKRDEVRSRENGAVPKKAASGARCKLYDGLLHSRDIYADCLNYVASFLKWLNKANKEIYEAILPLLDYCPITTFFILFEPYKGDYYFIDDELINRWHCSHKPVKAPHKVLIKHLKASSGGYAHVRNFQITMSDIRNDVIDIKNVKSAAAAIASHYNNLVHNNVVGDAQNVLPDATWEYIKKKSIGQYNMKLFQDELRVYIALSRGEESDKEIIRSLKLMIKMLPRYTNLEYAQSLAKLEYMSMIWAFSQSLYYLYVCPVTSGEFGGTQCAYSDIDPSQDTYYDCVAPKMAELDTFSTESDMPSMEELCEGLDVLLKNGETIPEELLARLRPEATTTSVE